MKIKEVNLGLHCAERTTIALKCCRNFLRETVLSVC